MLPLSETFENLTVSEACQRASLFTDITDMRYTRIDNEPCICTQDLVRTRLNINTFNGIVTRAYYG